MSDGVYNNHDGFMLRIEDIMAAFQRLQQVRAGLEFDAAKLDAFAEKVRQDEQMHIIMATDEELPPDLRRLLVEEMKARGLTAVERNGVIVMWGEACEKAEARRLATYQPTAELSQPASAESAWIVNTRFRW